jgi:uncharacterized protein (DUF1015 family)
MPVFKPFRGYLPAKHVVGDTVLGPNEKWQANSNKLIQADNPYSFHHILQAADPAGQPDMLDAACAVAGQVFEQYLETGVYQQDELAAYYLYYTRYKNLEQTGLIGLSSIADYRNAKIKKHEHVRNDRVEQLYRFMAITGLHTTPVFLTYSPDKQISDLLYQLRQTTSLFSVKSSPVTEHQLWRIDSPEHIQLISERFASLPAFYIADGHHRAAVSELAAARDPKHPGDFLTILIPSNDLTIYPFYRRIHQSSDLPSFDQLCSELNTHYHLQAVLLEQMYYQYLPKQHFLLCSQEKTYLIQPKEIQHHNDPLKDLDVSLLQDNIISKILGINNPKSDKRISFGPMSIKLEAFKELLADADTRYILVPRAPLAESIFEVADRGEVMPPKSTSFEPKIKSGLVLYRK